MRVGFSKDIHNLKDNKNLILGGVVISNTIGVDSYSDGDVLLHAICESLLGAMGLNDLGHYFNENNSEKNFSSKLIVDFTLLKLIENNYKIVNIDTLTLLDNIKLYGFIDNIKLNLSKIFNLNINQITVKATTTEKNFVEFIECNSIVLIEKENK